MENFLTHVTNLHGKFPRQKATGNPQGKYLRQIPTANNHWNYLRRNVISVTFYTYHYSKSLQEFHVLCFNLLPTVPTLNKAKFQVLSTKGKGMIISLSLFL